MFFLLNKKTLGYIVLVGLVLFVVYSLYCFFIPSRSYQAVFLSNDQVYFGKLSGFPWGNKKLRDVYYLRVTEGLQSQDGRPLSQEIQLIRLGNEIHGPTREMVINPKHILFVEKLRDDSAVVKSIREQGGSTSSGNE